MAPLDSPRNFRNMPLQKLQTPTRHVPPSLKDQKVPTPAASAAQQEPQTAPPAADDVDDDVGDDVSKSSGTIHHYSSSSAPCPSQESSSPAWPAAAASMCCPTGIPAHSRLRDRVQERDHQSHAFPQPNCKLTESCSPPKSPTAPLILPTSQDNPQPPQHECELGGSTRYRDIFRTGSQHRQIHCPTQVGLLEPPGAWEEEAEREGKGDHSISNGRDDQASGRHERTQEQQLQLDPHVLEVICQVVRVLHNGIPGETRACRCRADKAVHIKQQRVAGWGLLKTRRRRLRQKLVQGSKTVAPEPGCGGHTGYNTSHSELDSTSTRANTLVSPSMTTAWQGRRVPNLRGAAVAGDGQFDSVAADFEDEWIELKRQISGLESELGRVKRELCASRDQNSYLEGEIASLVELMDTRVAEVRRQMGGEILILEAQLEKSGGDKC